MGHFVMMPSCQTKKLRRLGPFRVYFLAAVTFILTDTVSGASITAQVSDATGAPVEDAVVFAILTGGQSINKPIRNGLIDQINKEFVPFVTPIQVGAAVAFPNKDNIRHQVYSFSPAKVFNLKLYSGVRAEPVIFDKPGAVILGCNIHDKMLAYVYVVDTPYFTKSVKTGNARIDDIAAGIYEVKIWHPNLEISPEVQSIRIRSDATEKLTFSIKLSAKLPVKK